MRWPLWFKPPGPPTFPPDRASALVDNPDNLVFIAEIVADPVGCVYAGVVRRAETPWRPAYEMIYVNLIAVRAAHRRQGIGAALLGALRTEAANRKVAMLGLDVWSFNADAKAFFQSQGFAPYNERLWSSVSEAGR
jgi:GNAT superfamily N-acetyltransferase